MTTYDDEWIFEGPDYEVGIFGESVYHDPCVDEDDDPFEAEELESITLSSDDGKYVITTRFFRCPNCHAVTDVQEAYPADMFEEPREDDRS